MSESLFFISWCIVIGLLLIAMTLGSSFIARLPLSSAMLYLIVGYAIGPSGLGLLNVDPSENADLLERLTEIAVLISLFNAGFKLQLPLSDGRWRIPARLASLSMMCTVALVAAIGVFVFRLPLGAAILLGAILAPTDPVLASDVQVEDPSDSDRLRFGLTGEGGLNDGTAFPFIMLGLGLLSLHELGSYGARWLAIDVVWAVAGGLAIGYLLGTLVGRAILYLRTHHREALGSDEFIAFGLIALAYGVALLCKAYGFLAVFAAGLALRRLDCNSSAKSEVMPPHAGSDQDEEPSPEEMPAQMMYAVQNFNAQLERFAEVAIVIIVGALLPFVRFRYDMLWFVPLLFVVIRPAAVWIGLLGARVAPRRRLLMSWFGIRGIGSLYYLMYAINHGVESELGQDLLDVTVAVVVASVIAHGISVTPLMNWYERRRPGANKASAAD